MYYSFDFLTLSQELYFILFLKIMNISFLLKYLNKLKGKWGFVGKLLLGLLILLLSTSYLLWRFPAIIVSGEKQIDTAVIAISAIIILLPFLSEIELFGVKFKKEIEELEKNTSDKIRQMDQRLLAMQSQNINQYFYQPKTDEERKKLTESAQEAVQDLPKNKKVSYQVDAELVHLFTIKWKIRRAVSALYKRYALSESGQLPHLNDSSLKLNTQQIIEILTSSMKVHNDIGEILQEMVAICDGAYFGREVMPEQLAFVNENEYIIDYLENL